MRLRRFILIIPFIAAIGCSELNSIKQDAPTKVVSSLAYGTKVSYKQVDSVLRPSWEQNDTISIFYEGNTYYYLSSDTGEETEFSPLYKSNSLPSIEDGKVVYACYPKLEISDNTINVKNVENNFHWRTDQILPYNYMRGVGVVKNGVLRIEFRLIYSYIKLVISKDYRGIAGDDLYYLCIDSDSHIPFHSNAAFHLDDATFSISTWCISSDWFSLSEENETIFNLETDCLYFAIEPGVYDNLSICVNDKEHLVYNADHFEFLSNTIYVLDPKMKTLVPENSSFINMPVIDL